MIFLGTTFFSGKNTLYAPATHVNEVSTVGLSTGTYNQLYVSKNVNKTAANWDDDWDFDTMMSASFNDNLDAGNSSFSLRKTDTIIIKRREVNKDNWVTIYTKDIETLEDFDINVLYRYARGNTEYVYRICSICNGIENSHVERQLLSSFAGMYIADKDSIYGTVYDLDGCDTTINQKSEVVEGYDSYPTVVSNSNIGYERGSVRGTFLSVDNNEYAVDLQSSRIYRQDVMERLVSKKPFVLKMPDGRAWLARCVGTPQDSMGGHEDIRQITFEWVEIGDIDDMETLYNNNLSDVEARWWS